MSVYSTPCCAHNVRSSSHCCGSTASTIRSCASDNQISHGARPGYFSGACVSSTRAPTPSAISPIAEDNPPAPQSVIARYKCCASTRTSITNFSVIGSPICTLAPDTSPVVASMVIDENVAPRRPSRPVRPPSTTMRSRACGATWSTNEFDVPMQPAYTSGLAVYPGSYNTAPATVGRPILFP